MPTLKHEYLPVFKMRAYDDLSARAAAGEAVQSSEIGKHRRDVFRLASLLPGDAKVALPDSIREEVETFLDAVMLPSPDYLKSIGLGGRHWCRSAMSYGRYTSRADRMLSHLHRAGRRNG